MTQKVFVVGTDTHVGKTWLTRMLTEALLAQGVNAIALKPIASGVDEDGINADVQALMQAQGLTDVKQVNYYTFAMPAAPALAARAEKKKIHLKAMHQWLDAKARDREVCLIEGVGGLMVPLADKLTGSDWLSQLPDAEVMLVVGARLGCLNHALLTLAKLEHMGRMPSWVMVNDCDQNGMAESMAREIKRWLPKGVRCWPISHDSALTGEALLALLGQETGEE